MLMNRRDFLKNIGIAGGTILLASSPWLSVFSDVEHTDKSVANLGIIGAGSRGRFLMSFLKNNTKANVIGICDIYQPSIDEALKIYPKATIYDDYRRLLENKEIEAVIIATPLNTHFRMAIDSFDAGKHVYCEKALAMTIDESFRMYEKHRTTGKIFFAGQQRLFDPRYIQAMEMIHTGKFGELEGFRTYWFRNNNWRRPVPSPDLERHINWRLYKDSSKGLMTELACHQIQIGTWAMHNIPNKVMGHGAITYWKDGRETYDNVSCIYIFDNGVKLNFESIISNKFYGLEEQILGNLGTMELEKGKYYFETVEPASGFLQLINDVENRIFDSLPFAGTSWAPETANNNAGEYILGERPKSDGTSLMMDSFVEAVITNRQPKYIAEEGYYATALCLLGHEAIETEKTVVFPDAYKIDYLNHKRIAL